MVQTAVTFYETFDWRLFNKSLTLCQLGNELVVRELPTGRELERLATPSPPAFGSEIAESSLQQRVAAIVGVRRLLPVGLATIQTAPYRIVNADGKTVARLLDTKVHAGPFDGREQVRGASSASARCLRRVAARPRLSGAFSAPGEETQRRRIDRLHLGGDF